MILTGRRVVITGAGRDLGRKLALRLAAQGASLFLSARDPAAARRTAEKILDRGLGNAHAFRCDLAEPESVRDFAAGLTEQTGQIDVLINNGARYIHGPDLAAVADDDIIETVAGAVTGTILLTKHLLPLLQTSDKPDIVANGSAEQPDDSEDDPHRLLDYSLAGHYGQDPYTAEDLDLVWVQEQEGDPYSHGLVDSRGEWLIPLGKHGMHRRAFAAQG